MLLLAAFPAASEPCRAARSGQWIGSGSRAFATPFKLEVGPPVFHMGDLQTQIVWDLLLTLGLSAAIRGALIHLRMRERQAERERIARELHDTLLQGVQALLLRVHNWEMEPAIPERHQREIHIVAGQARALVVETRQRILGLRSSALRSLELAAVLKSLLGRQRVVGGPRLTLGVVGQPRPVSEVALQQVISIAREALNNAQRHANATRIDTSLEFRGDLLRMSISDDGIGIDYRVGNRLHQGTHFGIMGMRERALELGGRLWIGGNEGGGTLVTLVVPARVAFRQSGFFWWRPVRHCWSALSGSVPRESA